MKKAYLAVLLVPVFALGCPKKREEQPQDQTLTSAEALRAVDQAAAAGEAENLTGSTIEIATDFTLGAAVEAAAEEVGNFVESQLPCAEITLVQNELTVEYGAKAGNCTYKGHTYSGKHIIAVEKNENSEIIVHHEWDALSNGVVEVSGTATATWSFADQTRHIVHELEWTRLRDGLVGVGSGDRLQEGLEGNILEGIAVDGYREWTSEGQTWRLDIDEVEWRWADPVPQYGAYVVTNPDDKTLTLSFERVDEDTINVMVLAGELEFDFNVSKAGNVEQGEDTSS